MNHGRHDPMSCVPCGIEWARECAGKRAHQTLALASQHAEELCRKVDDPLAFCTYWCKWSADQGDAHWHVGHTRPRQRRLWQRRYDKRHRREQRRVAGVAS